MSHTLSASQLSIINGSLLGDGNLSKPRTAGENSYFVKGQKGDRRQYLQWHFDQLQPYSSRLKDNYHSCNGKQYPHTDYATRSHPIFLELRKKWYPEGKKIVPSDLTLDPLALAIWYFDDGTNNVTYRYCRIATYAFSLQENQFLIQQLKSLGIKANHSEKNGIHILAESYQDFIEIIKPYMIWDCFDYKISYRDPSYIKVQDHQKEEMCKMRADGMKLREIADHFGFSTSCISAVVKRSSENYNPPPIASSGYRNVYWDKSRCMWKAHLTIKGKGKYLGHFANVEDATRVVRTFRDDKED